MDEVNIEKGKLLEIIRENKIKHIEEFSEAVTDYKLLVEVLCKDNLKLAKTGDLTKFKDIQHIPAAPESHEHEYFKAIRMLELSSDEIIRLDSERFNQLVLDEWRWKATFSTSNAFYKSALSNR